MSIYQLLKEDDFQHLPENDRLAFANLEAIARGRMNEIIERTESDDYYNRSVRSQYIAEISGLASELGMNMLPASEYGTDFDSFEIFLRDVSSITIGAFIGNAKKTNEQTVRLSQGSRERIRNLFGSLKNEINQSNLSYLKKQNLIDRLENLEKELDRERVSLSKFMGTLGVVMATVVGGTTLLADAPDAASTIYKIFHYIGIEKEKEEEHQSLINQERNRLGQQPARPALPKPTPRSSFDELEDDIPF